MAQVKVATNQAMGRTGLSGVAKNISIINGDKSTTEILMGLGNTLTSAAAMFQKDDAGSVSVQRFGNRRAMTSRRRKIA